MFIYLKLFELSITLLLCVTQALNSLRVLRFYFDFPLRMTFNLSMADFFFKF